MIKKLPLLFCTKLVQNSAPMRVATYQGIKIADKLPSVEALQERIKLLEALFEQE
ncbi:MAG: hypothetical protein IKX22_04440 [Prevotella sp.]|nr:hypothetical protein [Prevotella sp.]